MAGKARSDTILIRVMNGIHIFFTPSQIVGIFIPPLLRLGLVDRSGCVVVGGAIGIVGGLGSTQVRSDKLGN